MDSCPAFDFQYFAHSDYVEIDRMKPIYHPYHTDEHILTVIPVI
jgi:hypothetical protein